MVSLDFNSLSDMGFYHVLSSIYKPLKEGLDKGLGIDDFVEAVEYMYLDDSDSSTQVISEIYLADGCNGLNRRNGLISLAKFSYETACSFCGNGCCVYNKSEMCDGDLVCEDSDLSDVGSDGLNVVDSCRDTGSCSLQCNLCLGLAAGGSFGLLDDKIGYKHVFSNIRDVLCKCTMYSGVDFSASFVGLTRYLSDEGINRNLTGVDVGSYSLMSPYFPVKIPSCVSVGLDDDVECKTSGLCSLSDILGESDEHHLKQGDLSRIQDLYFNLGVNLAHRYQIYKLGYIDGFDGREVLRLLVLDFENLLTYVHLGFRVKVAFLTCAYRYLMDESNYSDFEFVGDVSFDGGNLIDLSFRFGGFFFGFHQDMGLTLVHKDGIWVNLWRDEPIFRQFESILCHIYFSRIFGGIL